MPGRLIITRSPDSEGRILSDVPAPARMAGGSCALATSLMATVRYVGLSPTYDDVMGHTGVAFILPLGADLLRAPGDALRCQRIPQALATWGLRGEWRLLPGVPSEIASLIRVSLDAGFPVPVLGWPRRGDDWALIAGHDPSRGMICGWPAGQLPDVYLGAQPAAEAAILISGRTETPEAETAMREALQWAASQAPAVRDAYRLWDDLLAAGPGHTGDETSTASWAFRHQWAAESLADARTAACGFLQSCAEALGGVASQWLLAAAENYNALVNHIESAGLTLPTEATIPDLITESPLPDDLSSNPFPSHEGPNATAFLIDGRDDPTSSLELPHGPEPDPDWREHWRHQLAEAARLDLHALACLRLAFTTDYLPEEWDQSHRGW